MFLSPFVIGVEVPVHHPLGLIRWTQDIQFILYSFFLQRQIVKRLSGLSSYNMFGVERQRQLASPLT
jgi:hypothetical protein